MRDEFISNARTIIEKEFWKQFFVEVDKRSLFVRAKFNTDNFGVHIHNPIYFNSSDGVYSLMYTRNGLFKMNNIGFDGKKWNGLGRLKYWCNTSGLPEKFYSELNKRKLLSLSGKNSEIIDIPLLLKSKTPPLLVEELFQCIDLFK